MIRAFMAVEVDDALRVQIGQIQQDLKERLTRAASGAVRIAWVRPASIHLTLKFLGDIDERLVGALHETIAVAARDFQPTRIPLARLGAFPRPQEPRALWIGAPGQWEGGDDASRLAALVRAIEDCCKAEGVPPEGRPWAPHLTLARIKAGERQVGRALADLGAWDRSLPLEPLAMKSLALMKSQLNSDGAVHTRLWDVRLGAVS